MANIEQLQMIHAPAAEVYQALTSAEGLAEVWTRDLLVQKYIGAVNEFHFGKGDLAKMEIIELVPEQRIVWRCIDSDPEWIGTTISFELEEKNDQTVLTLCHANWQKVTDFYRFCNYNWAMFLYSLKRYCEEGEGMPYQERTF
ncbi:SRPBCC domain-containing protein [Alkalihalobacillus oceani]|uniref:SRPBCC family protein n=1 Tax=Halalkalibacter oceani TaxID=1653776 RepID=UPI00203C198C|nr:SRPBCC domain-containing protein [Halalkalibacter oceani]MCM3762516.1 SRPBCC domain-containing protein [Halalkalibacter oceani]